MEELDKILGYEKSPLDDLYGLLGCDRSSSREQIHTEFKIRAKELHPDKQSKPILEGQEFHGDDDVTSDASTEQFQALQRAHSILSEPESRKLYDSWLDAGIAMSFNDWLAKKNMVHLAMHWAQPRQPVRAIGEVKGKVLPKEDQVNWRSEGGSVLEKFRRYEI